MGGPFAVELDHVQLAMPAGEEGRARSFYRELLGLARPPRPAATLTGLGGDSLDSLHALAGRLYQHGNHVRWDDALPGVRRFHTDNRLGNRLERR